MGMQMDDGLGIALGKGLVAGLKTIEIALADEAYVDLRLGDAFHQIGERAALESLVVGPEAVQLLYLEGGLEHLRLVGGRPVYGTEIV